MHDSFLENYNRLIKGILGHFLKRRGKIIIPRPLLLVIIKKRKKINNLAEKIEEFDA